MREFKASKRPHVRAVTSAFASPELAAQLARDGVTVKAICEWIVGEHGVSEFRGKSVASGSPLRKEVSKVLNDHPEYVFKPDQLDPEHHLGGGAFGQVYKGFAIDMNYKSVAVKMVPLRGLKKKGNEAIKKSVDKVSFQLKK